MMVSSSASPPPGPFTPPYNDFPFSGAFSGPGDDIPISTHSLACHDPLDQPVT